MSDNRTLEFIKGMIVGGTLGAIVALLYAPKSGRETREDLSGKMDDVYVKAREEYEDKLQRARTSYESTLERLKDLELDARRKAEEVQGLVEDATGKGKERVEGSRKRLKKALDAAKEAFKDEDGNGVEDVDGTDAKSKA